MTAAPRPVVAPPSSVVNAYRLYLVGAALNLVSIVLTFVLLPSLIALATEQAQSGVSGQNTQGVDVAGIATGAAIGAAVFGAVVSVAYIVLTVVFARKMLGGRNWARIVLAVFAGLHLVGLLALALPGGAAAGVLAVLLTVLTAVAYVTAAVLSFLASSTLFFRAGKARPAAY